MSALLVLLLCEVGAPLGPYARPGVPVVLEVSGHDEVVVEGWRYKARPLIMVHPPRVPCTVRDADGRELLRLEAVPDGKLLIGIVGDAPPGLAVPCEEGFEPLYVPRIRVEALDGAMSRAFDLFDQVLVPPDAALGPGLMLWPGDKQSVPGEKARPPVIPRTRNVFPEVYDLIELPRGWSPAFYPAGLIVIGAGLVMGVQLLLAARGSMSLRSALTGIALVALLGAGAGWFSTRAAYSAVVTSEIRVKYYGEGSVRTRIYTVFTAVGPGASVTPMGRETPVFYRAPGDPWWSDGSRTCALEPGVMRLFVSELGGPLGQVPTSGLERPHPLAEQLRPLRGSWKAGTSGPSRLWYVAQD